MRKKNCHDIIEHKRKGFVIVDEPTTLSQKIILVICLRTAIVDNIVTLFFNTVELNNTSADLIKIPLFRIMPCIV